MTRPQTARARISNPVSGGQCQPICALRWPKARFISFHFSIYPRAPKKLSGGGGGGVNGSHMKPIA